VAYRRALERFSCVDDRVAIGEMLARSGVAIK
jgi:hypothetical protein